MKQNLNVWLKKRKLKHHSNGVCHHHLHRSHPIRNDRPAHQHRMIAMIVHAISRHNHRLIRARNEDANMKQMNRYWIGDRNKSITEKIPLDTMCIANKYQSKHWLFLLNSIFLLKVYWMFTYKAYDFLKFHD